MSKTKMSTNTVSLVSCDIISKTKQKGTRKPYLPKNNFECLENEMK